MAVLGNSLGDSDERVQWRTSVVLDYAHMLQAVTEKFTCESFLSSEDDVAHLLRIPVGTKPPFSLYNGEHKNGCTGHQSRVVKYTGNGALSFLHDCAMLSQLAYYLRGNANRAPLDWLVNYFYENADNMRMESCSYVEHLGRTSTFGAKP